MSASLPHDRDEGAPAARPDWRGWLGVAWVLFWGAAYAVMAIEARAPQLMRLIASLASRVSSGR